MDLEFLLRTTAHLFTAYAPYSPVLGAFTVSMSYTEFLYDKHIKWLPQAVLLSLPAVLEEGKRRGLWDITIDPEYLVDIVVIRW